MMAVPTVSCDALLALKTLLRTACQIRRTSCYKHSIVPCSLQEKEVLMPRPVHRPRLSQPTLFHRPHRHPLLQTFAPDVQEKTIRLLAALLRGHVRGEVIGADEGEEARDE
jgi:hypothetical protein